MQYTNFPRFVFLLILLSTNITLNSQSSRQAKILYNGKEVTAEISDNGSILNILDVSTDELAGYTMKVEDYLSFLEGSNTTETVLPSNSKEDKTIFFQNGFATLSERAISELDQFARILKSNPSSVIVLRSLQKNGQNPISENRTNAIKTYLNLKGVQSSAIKTEFLKGDSDINEVKIHFLSL